MKTMKFSILIVLLLSLSAPFIRAETETTEETADVTPDSAFILVRRDVDQELPLVGKPLNITVELFNAGEREASNVEVKDPEWDEKLFRSEGDSSASFEVIPAGATKSFSYSVTPKIKLQRFEQPQTEIKYNDGDKEIKSHGPTLYLQTFSGEDWLKYKAIKLGSTLTFGMMKTETQWIRASVMTVGSCFVYVTIQLVRGFKEASATRRRRRALAELEKDE